MKRYPNPIIMERINIMKRNLLLSDKEMANLCGVNRKTIYDWRAGVSSPPAEVIGIWAMRYNVSAEWLLGITDEGEPKPIPITHNKSKARNIRRAGLYEDEV